MKKSLAFLMATSMLASMPLAAYATGSQTGTTTLTTTIQPATYTLNVPADMTIQPGATQVDIGSVTVSDASGFSPYKGLAVTLEPFDHLKCEDVDTYIQYWIVESNDTVLVSGGDDEGGFCVWGNTDGGLNTYDHTSIIGYTLEFQVNDATQWQKAKAGEYTSTITFTAEVVYQEN